MTEVTETVPSVGLSGPVSGFVSGRNLGLLVTAGFPALFWTALLSALTSYIGHPASAMALVAVAVAIVTFLTSVVQALPAARR